MDPIEWHRGFADSRGARLAAYALVGPILGFALLVGVGLVVLLPAIAGSLLANPPVLVLVVVLTLVGGPSSLLYLWPLLTDPDQRRGLSLGFWLSDLPTPGVLVATVLGLVAHLLAFRFVPLGPLPVIAVGTLVGILGTGALLTEGRIDPDARTLTVRSSRATRETQGITVDLDLDAWTGLRTHRVGPVAVLRPSYAPGTRSGKTRLLTIPASVADEAAPVFAAAVDAPSPPVGRDPNPAVAATLALFGLGACAVGVAVLLLDVVPAAFRVWFAGVFGLFGAVFLVAARREGRDH